MKQEEIKDIVRQLKGVPDHTIAVHQNLGSSRNHSLLTEQFRGKADGKGSIEAYALFPGVEVSYNTFTGSRAEFHHAASDQIMELYYCRKGRIGWNMRHDLSVYLGAGDLTIHSAACCADSAMMFPLDYSQGISVSADLSLLKTDCPEILTEAGIDLQQFQEKFCGEKPVAVRSNQELERIFAPLFEVEKRLRRPWLKLKIQELFLYLNTFPLTGKELSQYASQQTDLIREIHDLLISHPERRYTIEQLSRRYLMNTSTLKEVFRRVYGQPIAAYMKEYRMRQAMILLRTTDEQISEIAGKMGYETPGKFSKAFKDIARMLPTEYRKLNKNSCV